MHLFTYGTLMFPDVWRRVVGRDFACQPATLRGYAVYRVRDDVYPVLVASEPTATADGLVYFNLGLETVEKLDRYESNVYVRQTVGATLDDDRLVECQTYFLSPKHRGRATADGWTAAWFAQHALEAYLRRL